MKTQTIVSFVIVLAVVLGAGFLIMKQPEENRVEFPNAQAIPPTDGASAAKGYQFNEAVTFRLNERAIFPGELELILKEINDSRCPPDVQCIWAGELSAVFSVSGGKFGKLGDSREIRLGTAMNTRVSVNGYTFTLENATENSATIVVTEDAI